MVVEMEEGGGGTAVKSSGPVHPPGLMQGGPPGPPALPGPGQGVRQTSSPRATDFSIAAIMARSESPASNNGSPSPSSSPQPSPAAASSPSAPPPKKSRIPQTSATEDGGNTSGAEDNDKAERVPSGPNPYASLLRNACNSQAMERIECHLENRDLWERFNELGTEMIITKTGRRMFPTVRVSFSGLPAASAEYRYHVLLDIVPCDNKRYRYAYHRSCWLVAGKADPPSPNRLYQHPDSPYAADQLRKQVVSFEKVKLTNNEMDKHGHIVLNSMHKYQPRIHLIRRRTSAGNSQIGNVEEEECASFVFPETTFTAVTAYQNQLITKLKIDSNPFAKGFRDSTRLTDFDTDPVGNPLLGDNPFSRLMADPAALAALPPELLSQADPAAYLQQMAAYAQQIALFGPQAALAAGMGGLSGMSGVPPSMGAAASAAAAAAAAASNPEVAAAQQHQIYALRMAALLQATASQQQQHQQSAQQQATMRASPPFSTGASRFNSYHHPHQVPSRPQHQSSAPATSPQPGVGSLIASNNVQNSCSVGTAALGVRNGSSLQGRVSRSASPPIDVCSSPPESPAPSK